MSNETIRLVIVVGDFHADIADAMVRAAREQAKEMDIAITQEIHVAGSYEVPLVLDHVLARGDVTCAVILGFIEKGETLHGEVMGNVVHKAIVDLQLKHKKPVGIGIIGPGATIDQATARQEAYAKAAVGAAVQSVQALDALITH